MSELLNAALSYSKRGWKVFPVYFPSNGGCSCGYKCSSPGKHPITARGVLDASGDEFQIRKWWNENPEANIGIATGNGLVVLDIDPKHGGQDSADTIGKLPETPSVITGSKGTHVYFSGSAKNAVGVMPGIDIRGDGGYVVAPPSRHISGETYEWDSITESQALAEWDSVVAKLPAKTRVISIDVESVKEGARNNFLASVAGILRRRGLSQLAIEAALLVENEQRCHPPLEEREVQKIAQNISRYQAQEPVVGISGTISRSAPDYLNLDIPKQRYLVEGIWPEYSIGFVAGPPKVFKSFLSMELACAAATGRPFLEKFPVPAPRTVLLVQQESSRAAFKERLGRAVNRYGEAPTLYVISQHPMILEDEVSAEKLRFEIGTIKPDLVILDSLSYFTGLEQNSATEMGKIIRLLYGLRDEFETGFAIVHHTAKASYGSHGGRGMRGSSALHAAAEVGMYVERPDFDTPRSKVVVELKDGRGVKPFMVQLNENLNLDVVLDQEEAAAELIRTLESFQSEKLPWYNE